MKRALLLGFVLVSSVLLFQSCAKESSFETDQDLALGSLHDSTDECYPISVQGTYYNGINAARDTNTIMLYINVTQPGEYTISSTTENGFSFSDTGFFSTVGLDSIKLQATGTPILIKPTDFTVSFNQTSCTFTVNVADSTGTGLSGSNPGTGGGGTGGDGSTYVDPSPAGAKSWKFTDSTNNQSYSGSIALASVTSDATLGINTFTIIGNPSGDYSFGVVMSLPTPTITTGSYPLDGLASIFYVNATDQSKGYTASGGTANEATDPSYINITSYNATTKQVQGSFRCWAIKDQLTDPVMIKGSFNTVLQ